MNAGLIRDLKLESERAQTEIPSVDPKTWVVFGLVRDEDLKGVPALTVALYDAKANWIEESGFACTQQNGSFRIETKDLEHVEGPLFLRVLTAQAAHLYADTVALTPKAGGLAYREIILPEGAQVCAAPVTRPHDPVAAPNTWVVRGRVTDAKGKALSGLTVTLYDEDLLFDDRLGQTETDENGDYSFTYRSEDFGDLISRKPDLFLTVMSPKEEKLFTSKRKVIFQAGKIEIVNIQIDKPDTAPDETKQNKKK
jgi:hypothetical protein